MIKWKSHDLPYLHYVLSIQALTLSTTARKDGTTIQTNANLGMEKILKPSRQN